MREGLVSIITPTYNCAAFLGETIRAVLAQTYTDWELIIVDDCSQDDTEALVSAFARKDPRIRYYRLSRNAGAAAARTEAMRQAGGEYMAFCDSDDVWFPDKLERQLAFMRKTGHAFTCTAYEQIDEDGKSLGRVVVPHERCDYNRLLLDCPVGNSTVMYSVAVMGKFEVPDIRKRNDDALWLKMLKKEPYIWGMTDVLTGYRVRRGSISSNKLELIRYHWILYRKIEHLSAFRSLFHIGYWCVVKVLGIK